MTSPVTSSLHTFLQRRTVLPAVFSLVAMTLSSTAADAPKPAEGQPATGTATAAKSAELRKPGFIFLQLYTRKIGDYVTFFQNVMGCQVKSRDAHFAALETDVARMLISDPDVLPPDHPFYKKLPGNGEGMGVEIGLVVADAIKACEIAHKQPGWTIQLEVAMRPWGVRDFRVLSPDGYFLRFTEPPH